MIEPGIIGELAAEFMDELEERYGASAQLKTLAVVVEVEIDEEDGPGWTEILYRCSDNRRWVQAGFFTAATRAVYESENDEE